MYSIIAMAGLADAAFLYGLLIVAAHVGLAAGLLAFALWKHSTVAATIACVV